MTTIKKTTFALATGLLASMLASTSSNAQQAEPAAGLTPGQPFVLSVSAGGTHITVVAAGRTPLESEPRVALFLPDLENLGDQEPGQKLVYSLSIQGDAGLTSQIVGKGQWEVGRLQKTYKQSPAGPSLGTKGGATGGSILLLGADGIQLVPVHDMSDDIVWIDSCVHGFYEAPGAELKVADGDNLEGGGASSLNVSTSTGGAKAP